MLGSAGSTGVISTREWRQLPAPPSLPFLPVSPSNTVSLSASMPGKKNTRNGNVNVSAGGNGDRLDRHQTPTPELTRPCAKLADYLQMRERSGKIFLSVSGNKPGQCPRLPQSTASWNIGASQRCSQSATAESREQSCWIWICCCCWDYP